MTDDFMRPKRQYNVRGDMPLASNSAKEVREKRERDAQLAGRTDREKRDLDEALARRREANTPWPPKTRETGKRYMVRCCLPCDPENDTHFGILLYLQKQLCDFAGGFTSYAMTGGWRTGSLTITEHGMVYEASTPDYSYAQDLANAFEQAGRDLGQEWTYIELHTFDACHAFTGTLEKRARDEALARRRKANTPWDRGSDGPVLPTSALAECLQDLGWLWVSSDLKPAMPGSPGVKWAKFEKGRVTALQGSTLWDADLATIYDGTTQSLEKPAESDIPTKGAETTK